MASTAALATRTAHAQARIDAAASAMAERLAIAEMVTTNHRDQAVRIMLQLEAVSNFLETVLSALPKVKQQTVETPKTEPPPESPKKNGKGNRA